MERNEKREHSATLFEETYVIVGSSQPWRAMRIRMAQSPSWPPNTKRGKNPALVHFDEDHRQGDPRRAKLCSEWTNGCDYHGEVGALCFDHPSYGVFEAFRLAPSPVMVSFFLPSSGLVLSSEQAVQHAHETAGGSVLQSTANTSSFCQASHCS
uniref:Uncharacterized protein n=1 Tax=Craspedostauros australis TaxID=1486917 RepID=A0A7R9WV65_9STRA|mmetsp:Transcript_19482/g.54140  ORF Transcript_19482/g.54140 Transcript_19482/m.54140 type:complete len:154 (+) Transcript_19482:2-463(+)